MLPLRQEIEVRGTRRERSFRERLVAFYPRVHASIRLHTREYANALDNDITKN